LALAQFRLKLSGILFLTEIRLKPALLMHVLPDMQQAATDKLETMLYHKFRTS
jgi:hypothetical protein